MAVRLTVALLAGALHAAADDALKCLVFQGDGCHKITDKVACGYSRDGRMDSDLAVSGIPTKIRDEPCVWCSGKPCVKGEANLCEPRAYVVAKRGLYSNDTVATCELGKTLTDTFTALSTLDTGHWIDQRVQIPNSKFEQQRNASGFGGSSVCRSAAGATWVGPDPMSDLDYKWGYRLWTAKTLQDCQGLCDETCTGVEWKPDSFYCEVWYDIVSHIRADLTASSDCYVKDVNCLASETASCREHAVEAECLGSRNGKEGQPCAWCGGADCLTGEAASKCVSMDVLFAAVKAGTATAEAKTSTQIAHCKSNSVLGGAKTPRAVLQGVPDTWNPVKFPPAPVTIPQKPKDELDVKKVVAVVGLCIALVVCLACYCNSGKEKKPKTRAVKMDREVQPLMEIPKAREVQYVQYQQVAQLGVSGRYQYLEAAFVEGCRPFMDAPTVLSNVPPTLKGSRLFRGPRMHQAGDSMTVSGPAGTMVHVILGETNDQAAKMAMHQAMTQQGWDYFDVQMAADGVVGHRIYLAQLQQPITISLSTPTSFIIGLTHTPLIPATYTPGSTPGSISFPAGSFVR